MENVNESGETKKESFASKAGQIVANVAVSCIAVCVSAIAIAITVRFIVWLF